MRRFQHPLTGERIDGNVMINSRRSDINLFDVGGTFTINAQYGELKLSPNLNMRDLQIIADKSDVYIYEPIGGEGLAYDFSLNNGEVKLPDDKTITELQRTPEVQGVQQGHTDIDQDDGEGHHAQSRREHLDHSAAG